MKLFENVDTKIFALGGLGEVGKNMYCVMTKSEIVITDVGVIFPSDDMPGVDYIIPDFVHVLADGRIVKTGDKNLALELEKNGYAEFE